VQNLDNLTLAFAGICQAAALVQQVARNGDCDHNAMAVSLGSILETHPKQAENVFGSKAQLRFGYRTLIEQLGNTNAAKNAEVTRYIVSLIALERKLIRRRDLLNMLSDRVSQIHRQLGHFELLDEQVLANIAGIYSDIISPLGPRIQVAGTPLYLQQTQVQHKVRALLLAGIRACVLWRQMGGKRRHIIFSRKKMIEHAKLELARNIPPTQE